MSECDNDLDSISLDSLECINVKPSKAAVEVASHNNISSHMPFLLHHRLSLLSSCLFPNSEQPREESYPSVLDDLSSQTETIDNVSSPRSLNTADVSYNSENRVWNAGIDDEVLTKKGLQRNIDGSFSKLSDFDESLPFVTKEYRDIDFKKRKQAGYKKNPYLSESVSKSSELKFNIKKDEGLKNFIHTSIKGRENSEIMIGQCYSADFGTSTTFEVDDNLTDSMKEKLMKTCERVASLKLPCVSSTIQKVKIADKSKARNQNHTLTKGIQYSTSKIETSKRDIEALTTKLRGNQQELNAIIKERSKIFTKTNHLRDDHKTTTKAHASQSNTDYKMTRKKKSEFLLPLTRVKPKLTYFERYQKENGYDPAYLRQCSKDTPTDSSRSNFGDSGPEKLSDISSQELVPDRSNIEDDYEEDYDYDEEEDEEGFYRRLILQDKLQRDEFSKKSSSSWAPSTSSIPYPQPESYQINHKETSQKSTNTKSKMFSKKNIRMPTEETKSPKRSPKVLPSPTYPEISKAELASRAKAYGQLVNSRNICKWKSSSKNKLVKKNEKLAEQTQSFSNYTYSDTARNSSGSKSPNKFVVPSKSFRPGSRNLKEKFLEKRNRDFLPAIPSGKQSPVSKNKLSPKSKKRVKDSNTTLPAINKKPNLPLKHSRNFY